MQGIASADSCAMRTNPGHRTPPHAAEFRVPSPACFESILAWEKNQPRHGCRGGLGEKKTKSRVRVGHVCPTVRGWCHPPRRCLHGCSDSADMSAQPAARTACRLDAAPGHCDRGAASPARHPLAGAIEVAAAFP
jgi:hypothetical protein